MQGMRHRGAEADGGGAPSWADGEVAGCDLGDRRLVERLRTLLRQLGAAVGQPLPLACQDWAATKAAYRFFDNAAVRRGRHLGRALRGNRYPVRGQPAGPLLVLQDTTEFSLPGRSPAAMGRIGAPRSAPRSGGAASQPSRRAGC